MRGDGETRAALTAIVDGPVGEISFTTTHLNWKLHHSDTRCEQVDALAAHVLAHRPKGGFPPVVVGDFNAEPDSDEIRFMRGAHAIGGKSVYFNDAFRVAGDPVAWLAQIPFDSIIAAEVGATRLEELYRALTEPAEATS